MQLFGCQTSVAISSKSLIHLLTSTLSSPLNVSKDSSTSLNVNNCFPWDLSVVFLFQQLALHLHRRSHLYHSAAVFLSFAFIFRRTVSSYPAIPCSRSSCMNDSSRRISFLSPAVFNFRFFSSSFNRRHFCQFRTQVVIRCTSTWLRHCTSVKISWKISSSNFVLKIS